jgi:hypothetical protein
MKIPKVKRYRLLDKDLLYSVNPEVIISIEQVESMYKEMKKNSMIKEFICSMEMIK